MPNREGLIVEKYMVSLVFDGIIEDGEWATDRSLYKHLEEWCCRKSALNETPCPYKWGSILWSPTRLEDLSHGN